MNWYAERRTLFGTWAPEAHADPPHGRDEEHSGEIAVKGLSGPRTFRRIFRVPEGMVGSHIGKLQEHFSPDPVEPEPETIQIIASVDCSGTIEPTPLLKWIDGVLHQAWAVRARHDGEHQPRRIEWRVVPHETISEDSNG